MTWCTDCSNDAMAIVKKSSPAPPTTTDHTTCSDSPKYNRIKACPSCGHLIKWHEKGGIHNLPGLPAGVKFDPSDQELLQHLEAKMMRSSSSDSTDHDNNNGLHPLIDEFIPTLEGENGICYAHPENLPGVSKDGFIRHFFHRPSKAYTTGTRKRRKVHADIDGNETRWHKTGKTRAVFVDQGRDVIKGYKKILVLYTNYGKQRKPEKTNWVMHQYHLGNNDDEKDGELVVSKIFYQTQPRQCNSSTVLPKNSHCSEAKTNDSSAINTNVHSHGGGHRLKNNTTAMFGDYYNQSLISFKQTT